MTAYFCKNYGNLSFNPHVFKLFEKNFFFQKVSEDSDVFNEDIRTDM